MRTDIIDNCLADYDKRGTHLKIDTLIQHLQNIIMLWRGINNDDIRKKIREEGVEMERKGINNHGFAEYKAIQRIWHYKVKGVEVNIKDEIERLERLIEFWKVAKVLNQPQNTDRATYEMYDKKWLELKKYYLSY